MPQQSALVRLNTHPVGQCQTVVRGKPIPSARHLRYVLDLVHWLANNSDGFQEVLEVAPNVCVQHCAVGEGGMHLPFLLILLFLLGLVPADVLEHIRDGSKETTLQSFVAYLKL